LIFSTELDGIAHIFHKRTRDTVIARFGTGENYNPEGVAEKVAERTKTTFDKFIADSLHPENIKWNEPHAHYGITRTDLTIPILRALSGIEPMRIVASRPNYGAVKDMPYDAPLEYSMDIYKDEIKPVENLYIPSPFKGLISSLAEFQALQSRAIAEHDPLIFAHALEAYPVNQFSNDRNEFFRQMFDLYSDMDPVMFEARKFFE
jgi:alpha-galactosidase/6-phospho-beta-glucosidase family protein